MDFFKLKRHRLTLMQGQETINQVQHCHAAGAQIILGGVLVPGVVVTADPSAAPILVKSGSILRIQVTTALYLAFGDDPATMSAITSATSPGLYLPPGMSLVVATEDFLATSANPTRIEVLEVP